MDESDAPIRTSRFPQMQISGRFWTVTSQLEPTDDAATSARGSNQVKEEMASSTGGLEDGRRRTESDFFPSSYVFVKLCLVIGSMLAILISTLKKRPFSSDCSSPYYSHNFQSSRCKWIGVQSTRNQRRNNIYSSQSLMQLPPPPQIYVRFQVFIVKYSVLLCQESSLSKCST